MKNLNIPIVLALVYNSVDMRGVAAEPVVEELFFANKTVGEGLVTFEEDVKAETIFTEAAVSLTMQAYTCGVPTPAGSQDLFDTIVTPVKFLFYDEFCPDNVRFSRFKTTMKPGAWETMSTEFEQLIMEMYSSTIAEDVENKFWNNALAGTKTAVAALTAGTANNQVSTAEKTLVAATPTGLWDGVITRMIYNSSNPTQTAGVGERIKVAGTTITAANIKAEYEKVYAAIPAVVLENPGREVVIYAPRSHKQLINIANNVNTNYTKPFDVTGDKITFYGIPVVFVPIPENVLVAAAKQHIIWTTDLLSDLGRVQIEKKEAASDTWFIKVVATLKPHVTNQRYNVLYVG